MSEEQTYLGDGVYATYDGYGVELTTNSGMSQMNQRIYIEPQVYGALVEYWQKTRIADLKAHAASPPNGDDSEAK